MFIYSFFSLRHRAASRSRGSATGVSLVSDWFEQNMIWYKSYLNLSPIPTSRCRSLLRSLGEGPRASVPVEWPFGPVANDTGRDAYWGAQTERPFGPVVTAPLVVVHRLKHVRYVNGVLFPYCVSGAYATTLFLCDFFKAS